MGRPKHEIRDLRFSPDMDLEHLNLRPAGVASRVDRQKLLVLDDIRMILDLSDPDDVPAQLLSEYLDSLDYVAAVKTTDVLTDVYGQEEHRDRVIGLITGEIMEKHKDVLEIRDLLTDPAYAFAAEYYLLDGAKAMLGKPDKDKKVWDRLAICSPVELGGDDYLAEVAERHAFRLRDVKEGVFIWQWPPFDKDEDEPEWRSTR